MVMDMAIDCITPWGGMVQAYGRFALNYIDLCGAHILSPLHSNYVSLLESHE